MKKQYIYATIFCTAAYINASVLPYLKKEMNDLYISLVMHKNNITLHNTYDEDYVQKQIDDIFDFTRTPFQDRKVADLPAALKEAEELETKHTLILHRLEAIYGKNNGIDLYKENIKQLHDYAQKIRKYHDDVENLRMDAANVKKLVIEISAIFPESEWVFNAQQAKEYDVNALLQQAQSLHKNSSLVIRDFESKYPGVETSISYNQLMDQLSNRIGRMEKYVDEASKVVSVKDISEIVLSSHDIINFLKDKINIYKEFSTYGTGEKSVKQADLSSLLSEAQEIYKKASSVDKKFREKYSLMVYGENADYTSHHGWILALREKIMYIEDYLKKNSPTPATSKIDIPSLIQEIKDFRNNTLGKYDLEDPRVSSEQNKKLTEDFINQSSQDAQALHRKHEEIYKQQLKVNNSQELQESLASYKRIIDALHSDITSVLMIKNKRFPSSSSPSLSSPTLVQGLALGDFNRAYDELDKKMAAIRKYTSFGKDPDYSPLKKEIQDIVDKYKNTFNDQLNPEENAKVRALEGELAKFSKP